MDNSQVAAMLYEIADVLELQGIDFKPSAFRKAARMVEELSEDITVVAKEGRLEELPTIGKAIAQKITEYVTTGKLAYLDEIKKQVPGQLADFLLIQGLGPKKVRAINTALGISTIAALEKAAKEGKIRTLAGFGEKSEQDVLKGIALYRKGNKRMPFDTAKPIAQNLVELLKSSKLAEHIEIAGSLRRKKETIGDIDILATSKNTKKLVDFFTNMPQIERVLAKGLSKSSVLLKNGVQVDLRIVKEESFGAALQYFTGSKEHNVALRLFAIKKGLTLNEYGLFRKKDKKLIAAKTEQDIYRALGLAYIEPQHRLNQGEIENAEKEFTKRSV